MTNYQMAKHAGLIRTQSSKSEYRTALTANGLTVTNEEVTVLGLTCIEAEVETKNGQKLHIILGNNGTARIDKPNGTHKWVYEKTANQIHALIKQTLAFYNY